jgi:O-antigen/teichoic acid export membrane protein
MSIGELEKPRISRQLITIVKDTLVYGVTNAATLVVGILLMPLYTRIFSTAEYGAIEIITTLTTTLVLLTGMQAHAGIARYFYEINDKIDRRRLVTVGIVLSMFASLVISLVILPWSVPISSALLGSPSYGKALFVSLLTVPLNNLLNYICTILRLEWAKKKYVILLVLNTILMMLLSIYFVAYLKTGVEGVFAGYLIAYLVSNTIGLIYLRRSMILGFSFALARKTLAYSIPLTPFAVASLLGKYLDRLILIPLVGLAIIGVYTAGVKIATVIILVATAFQTAWQPYSMYLIGKENHKEIYSKVMTYFFAALSSVMVAVIVFSREILQLFTSSDYWDAHVFLGFLILAYGLNGAFVVAGIGLNVAKKTYLLTVAYLIGFAIEISFLLLLTPRIGITGAAIASLLSSIITLVIIFYFAHKHYPIGYDFKRILIFLLFAFVAVGITLLVDRYLHGILNISIKLGVLIIFYFGMYQVLPKSEISVLRNLTRNLVRSWISSGDEGTPSSGT